LNASRDRTETTSFGKLFQRSTIQLVKVLINIQGFELSKLAGWVENFVSVINSKNYVKIEPRFVA